MITCCDKKVKTKYCPNCGKQVDGDSLVLKWISDCQTALKYWVDLVESLTVESLEATTDPKIVAEHNKRFEKANKMAAMWQKRIDILKKTMKEGD